MDARSTKPGGRGRWTAWTALAIAVLAAACLSSGCGDSGPAKPAAGGHAGSWTLPDADPHNTRRVGGPIDAASVSRLRVAWTFPAKDVFGTPLVADGVVYFQDLLSDVFAVDVQSGRLLWSKRYQDADVGPNGVTFAGGRLFGATSTRAFALDARSGRELWSRSLVTNPHEGIDMAPGYADGTVYVSTVQTRPNVLYGAGARGVLWAMDAATGRVRWRWAQVPSDLWGRPDLNAGGGLWHPPAFDGRGHLYVDVANPAPFPGTPELPWGRSRPGPNRWTNSIAKLDARTGRLIWARQVLPHDLYDWDLETPVILTQAGGRALAIAAGKMGFVYAFDAASGALVWKRSVGVHNGHDRDNLAAMAGRWSALRSPAKLLPGQLGGVETPMAADERTVYVPVVNLPAIYTAEGQVQTEDPASTGDGELVALDLATGTVRWDRRLPAVTFGSATVVNDLVLTTTFDGTVWAVRADTGAVVWKASLPNRTNSPVAVAGDTLITAASVGESAREATRLVAYRLSG